MQFKLWLESTKEEYSNQLTNELCKFFKDNNRLPLPQNNPILGGYTSQIDTRVGYNTEITELKLFNHLQDLKNNIRFNSDEEILKNCGLESIIHTTTNMSKEERNEQNLRKVADFFNTHNAYPTRSTEDEEEARLARWLERKRQSNKGMGSSTIYPDEEQLGISLGLPDSWLNPQLDLLAARRKISSEENLKKLADFYKENGRYPIYERPEEKKLATWLTYKRDAKMGIRHKTIYPNEEKQGIDLGLPSTWLQHNQNELDSKENLKKLAELFKRKRKYPSRLSTDPEEKRLHKWLFHKRQAKKGTGTAIVYPNEEQEGIELGLPTNWLDLQR